MFNRVVAALLMSACSPGGPGSSTGTSSSSSSSEASTVGQPTSGGSTHAGTSTGAVTSTAGTTTTGTTTGTTSGTSGTTGTGDPHDSVATSTGEVTPSCPGGVELMQAQAEGFKAGIERCPGIGAHRDEAVMCKVVPATRACEPGACAGGCPGFPTGVCDESSPGDCACAYPCAEDADCGDGGACLCGTSDDFIFGTGCRPASCRTDADCGEFTCGVSPSICRDGAELHCHSAADACQTDEDCLPMHDRCAFDADADRWTCSTYAFCG